jgi:hypothetical protein
MSTTFFSSWSAPMAYVLGYWFADGNIYSQPSCGGYTVSIGSKDLAHLELLRETIGLGRLTRITGSDVFKLVICRKAMYEDLLRLGGSERKSLTLTWPHVPDEQLPHFVRGYIDGDGSLSWHRSGTSLCPLIEAAGTRPFLSGLTEAVSQLSGIPAPVCHHRRNAVCKTAWYGLRAKCLAIWLYHHHSGLALERKAALATDFAGWRPRNVHSSKITDEMWELFGGYLP